MNTPSPNPGPLSGVRVIEFAGLGPAPFCGMMLADMGADVTLVERLGSNPNAGAGSRAKQGKHAIFKRGKRSILMDLKKSGAVEAALELIRQSDILIEGFRPGIMERLGLGPGVCLAQNPRLIYGRMTGWGQSGPLADVAGHDINYLGISGVLHYAGHHNEAPFTPATVLGDVGAGAMSLAYGLMCALWEANKSGKGQVVDAAISDGAIYMSSLLTSLRYSGLLPDRRGESFYTAGAPWYDSYECSDGKYITLGAYEPTFYRHFLQFCNLDKDPDFADQTDQSRWPVAKSKLTALFKTRTRDAWCNLLEGTDTCVSPVLTLDEARTHPHNKARDCFIERDGITQPAPAPKFSRSPVKPGCVESPGESTREILHRAGFSEEQLAALIRDGAVG